MIIFKKIFILFIYLKKTFKYLVRQGIPNHLRSEIWHVFIQKQINHIRKEKGPSYFENLGHLLPNSDVRI
jgi:hypothetical protein